MRGLTVPERGVTPPVPSIADKTAHPVTVWSQGHHQHCRGRRTMELGGALESPSLVELTLHRLRQEILSGALTPGERLVEEHLTQRFGTSRAPLREALRQLAEQGLIEHLPRRGFRVAELSAADADELFGLRNVLERYAVDLAFARPQPVSLAG